jgi:pSer/pThr/pTyr-binding forkhead associated (FHA) protein
MPSYFTNIDLFFPDKLLGFVEIKRYKMFLHNKLNKESLKINQDYSFGREKGDVLFPEDDTVSTMHFKLLVEDDKFYILDIGSTNGTFINKVEIIQNTKIEIKNLDFIEFGEQQMFMSLNEKINIEEAEEHLREKRSKSLLTNIVAKKQKELDELTGQHTDLVSKYKALSSKVILVRNKFLKEQSVHKELHLQHQGLISEIKVLSLDSGQGQEKDLAEQKKIFAVKTDLMDQLKLLETTLADDKSKEVVIKKIENCEKRLKEIKNRSSTNAEKVSILKNEAIQIEKVKKEYYIKMASYKTEYDKLIQEMTPELNRIKSEVKLLVPKIEKAKESLKAS